MDRKWWTLVAVCTATFMLLLDITIVNVALPSIERDLGADLADLQWVVDAYALTLAALLLTGGSLADRVGRRLVFVIGLVIFTIASVLCGLAADALQPAGEVERERRAGEPAQHGGDGEDDEPDQEHAPAADAVGHRAAGQQQRGERERVGVDDPLQVGEVGAEVALDRRQRDVHDRDVEQQHERRQTHGEQRPPLAIHRFEGTRRG